MTPVRILIVDDHEPWRRMVITLLEEQTDWLVIGEASDGVEAVQKSKALQPDLILLDLGLPKLSGLEAARQIRELSPCSKILFLSESQCTDVIREAFRIGAAGYVTKSDAALELLTALETVLGKKQFVNSRFAACIPEDPTVT